MRRIYDALFYEFQINLDPIAAIEINAGRKLAFCLLCNVAFSSRFRRIHGISTEVVIIAFGNGTLIRPQ